MENMQIYNAAKECPPNALREIRAGRLKGKSDINPMWRIKRLTELFGACGVGWYYEVERQWTEQGANGEVAAFCNIALYIKTDGEWSKPIKGTGGSMFTANESKGLYTSDECYKMALTDAISVACKALGFAADVYWGADCTKYNQQRGQPQQSAPAPQQNTPPPQQPANKISKATVDAIEGLIEKTNSNRPELLKYYGVNDIKDLNPDQAKNCMGILKGRAAK